LKPERVREPAEPHMGLEPRGGFLIPLQTERHRLALLLGVWISDEERWGGDREGYRQIDRIPIVPEARADMPIRRERHADTGTDRSLLEPVVLQLSAPFEPRGRRRIVEELIPPTEPDPLSERAVVPGLRGGVRREGPGATLRDDVHDAPDGVRAIDRRLRAAHDLDPFDLIGREVGKIEIARGRTLDAQAVNKDLHLLRGRS